MICKTCDQDTILSRSGNGKECKPCANASASKWRKANPEKASAAVKKWRTANPAKLKAARARWYQENRELIKQRRRFTYGRTGRAWQLERRRQITLEQYNAMLEKQGYCCAICDRPPGAHRLAVDHDHATGKIRGLLCSTCNTALGSMQDNPRLLRKAALYLEES